MNIVAGERYKMNEEVRRKCIGDDKVITCRPADLLKPELPQYREESKDIARCEEDVLSYALFPQVARKFMEARNNPKPAEPEKKAADPEKKAADPNAVRELYVEDLGR